MRKFTTTLLSLFFIGACTTKAPQKVAKFDYAARDSALIAELVQHGSDANKEHQIAYLIDCETEPQVTAVASEAVRLGFEDDYVSYSDKRQVWTTSLIKSMKLNLEEISQGRELILPLMPPQGCRPIGWGASVVK